MNKILLGLIFLTSSFSIFLIGKCSSEIRGYFSLDQKNYATVVDWGVVEKTPSDFAVRASYYFFYGGQRVEGETEFTPPYFPSFDSANQALRKMVDQKWEVFFSSRRPGLNSLQKVFPFLLCIRAFLSGSLCVYFILLNRFSKRIKV